MTIPPQCKFCIDQSWWLTASYGHYEATLPATKHTAINKHTIQKGNIVKTRINYCYYYFHDSFWHATSTNCGAWSLLVVMVVQPTQCIDNDNGGKYTLYMSHLMALVLGLAHRPWLRPRQLTVGEY